MSRVEEIEAAIDGLSPDDYRRIVEWFRVREQRDGTSNWMPTLPQASSIFFLKKLKENPRRALFATGPRESEIRRYPAILGSLSGVAV
jgi:hypothetical protein